MTELLLKAVMLLAKELAVLSIYCKEDWVVPRKKEKGAMCKGEKKIRF